ncbi:hypothetical protein [Nocardia rhizosphaerae]|uniref:Uncharacterized protein n=1 Tax=Nocardia rhizosphaerae TaxID=1691571 RepID=A0ABV8L9A2_9NOCA
MSADDAARRAYMRQLKQLSGDELAEALDTSRGLLATNANSPSAAREFKFACWAIQREMSRR